MSSLSFLARRFKKARILPACSFWKSSSSSGSKDLRGTTTPPRCRDHEVGATLLPLQSPSQPPWGSSARSPLHRSSYASARIDTVSVDEVADRLYALPIEEFTQARNQAERELRKAGERDRADEVKALRKPTATAGAVNRLVRGHRAEVEAFLAAAARLRDAQFAGRGDLEAAAKAER